MAAWMVLAIALAAPAPAMSKDLMDVSVTRLEALYRARRYTVGQVVRWHLARMDRYDGLYRAVQTRLDASALAEAAKEDAQLRTPGFKPGPLFGVPIVIKSNTSVKGEVTTAGFRGFKLVGHELTAPRDAPIVAKLRAAGAIIVGISNMPDFAASDTTRSTAFGRTGNAYDVRFSPGGSSGGTVTSVTGNFAVLGNGTDTGNSIRMPVATSNLVGVFPTRGLVSIAGIAPMDWKLDNTGPIARSVEDAAIALTVMAGEDPLDPATARSAVKAQGKDYTAYLKPGALKGRRFGVPAFVMDGTSTVFQGVCPGASEEVAAKLKAENRVALHPDTRTAFLKALDELRAAGAEIVTTSDILPDAFADAASRICTQPYLREGYDTFLKDFGPAQYHSVADYQRAVGKALPPVAVGGDDSAGMSSQRGIKQVRLEDDPAAEATYLRPRREVLAAYVGALEANHLDGFVYPAAQMPPPDETMPQDGGVSGGPHSATAWVNMLGVPAISIPAGFYEDGLPFGIEFSARPWRDGDLIAWAYDYQRLTHHRRPPVLSEGGYLPRAAKPLPSL
ncbi:hypothetical protein BH09PSE2_BH09PSE2_18580 [soil metagenome]